MKKILLSFFILATIAVSAQNEVPAATTPTAGTLTVTTITTSCGGSYSPEHSLAIYVRNSSNALVNTLLYYTRNSNSSASDLTTWWSLITSFTTSKMLLNSDAITGATATSNGLVTCYWGKTASIATVADGNYTVNFEACDAPGKRGYTTGTFTKGPTAQTVTVPNVTGFTSTSIKWVPVNTAVQNLEMDKLYSVYPNPAISSIFVSGSDIKEVEICSLAGKSISRTNQQKVDISALAKGNYLAVIYAKTGTVVKKIQKL